MLAQISEKCKFDRAFDKENIMNWQLLMELSDAVGLPGYEKNVRKILRREFSKLGGQVKTDALGNIFCHIQGNGKILMLDAHMDEVGFMIKHIDENGFIYVVPLGGIDPRAYYAQRVIIFGKKPIVGIVGSTPPHLQAEKAKENVPEIEDCFIDTGFPPDVVFENIKIGDCMLRFKMYRDGEFVHRQSFR